MNRYAAEAIEWLVERVASFGFEGVFRRYYGTYKGIVKAVDDPDRMGRCRVLVPALGHTEAPASIWAKPIAFGHAGGAGFMFTFAVDDVVWVQFEGGEPSRPLIVGGFSSRNAHNEDFGTPLRHGVRTKGGHRIRLSDEDGEESVDVVSSGGSSVTLDKDGGITIRSAAGREIAISDSGEIRVVSQAASVVLTDSSVEVSTSRATFTLDDAKVSIGGAVQVEIGASAKVTVNGGMIELGGTHPVMFGDSFATLWSTHTHPTPVGPTGPPLFPMIAGVHYSAFVTAK